MKFKPFLTTLVLASALATSATAKTYKCSITPAGNGAWIPEFVVLDHDEATGDVVVLDELIKYFKDRPIEGEVSTDNAKRITYKWVLKDITVTGGGSRNFVKGFRFTLTVQKGSLKASMFSTPIGYVNRDNGEGRCTVE
ncbi:hypothetical protein [Aliiroseovarius sp.]|uniref:hypothetical protein n=1 Tax=Aliiroseovarius sp. TaxID=1872442 RepID=UPI003BAD677D